MADTPHDEEKMAKLYNQMIVLIAAAVFIAACATVPKSTSPPAAVQSMPTVTVAVPTSPPPTAESPTEIHPERSDSMKVRITVEDAELTATLIDSKTTQDFIAMLPLTLTLEDYGSTEKISYLSKRLSTEDAPSGIDPSVGDITYYAPWGNLAIFIRDFGYSSGLVLLGKIEGDIESLNVPGPLSVTIEFIE
jgi:hypothetical protein